KIISRRLANTILSCLGVVKYGDYSLDIEIFVYVDTVTLPKFLDIQEDILLQVNDIVQAAGTDFAFPSQTTYLAQDLGLKQDLMEQS
ncbi:MAG: hypothetical protein AAFO59_11155, partial [Cyanobacteria bacterium J06607_17]